MSSGSGVRSAAGNTLNAALRELGLQELGGKEAKEAIEQLQAAFSGLVEADGSPESLQRGAAALVAVLKRASEGAGLPELQSHHYDRFVEKLWRILTVTASISVKATDPRSIETRRGVVERVAAQLWFEGALELLEKCRELGEDEAFELLKAVVDMAREQEASSAATEAGLDGLFALGLWKHQEVRAVLRLLAGRQKETAHWGDCCSYWTYRLRSCHRPVERWLLRNSFRSFACHEPQVARDLQSALGQEVDWLRELTLPEPEPEKSVRSEPLQVRLELALDPEHESLFRDLVELLEFPRAPLEVTLLADQRSEELRKIAREHFHLPGVSRIEFWLDGKEVKLEGDLDDLLASTAEEAVHLKFRPEPVATALRCLLELEKEMEPHRLSLLKLLALTRKPKTRISWSTVLAASKGLAGGFVGAEAAAFSSWLATCCSHCWASLAEPVLGSEELRVSNEALRESFLKESSALFPLLPAHAEGSSSSPSLLMSKMTEWLQVPWLQGTWPSAPGSLLSAIETLGVELCSECLSMELLQKPSEPKVLLRFLQVAELKEIPPPKEEGGTSGYDDGPAVPRVTCIVAPCVTTVYELYQLASKTASAPYVQLSCGPQSCPLEPFDGISGGSGTGPTLGRLQEQLRASHPGLPPISLDFGLAPSPPPEEPGAKLRLLVASVFGAAELEGQRFEVRLPVRELRFSEGPKQLLVAPCLWVPPALLEGERSTVWFRCPKAELFARAELVDLELWELLGLFRRLNSAAPETVETVFESLPAHVRNRLPGLVSPQEVLASADVLEAMQVQHPWLSLPKVRAARRKHQLQRVLSHLPPLPSAREVAEKTYRNASGTLVYARLVAEKVGKEWREAHPTMALQDETRLEARKIAAGDSSVLPAVVTEEAFCRTGG